MYKGKNEDDTRFGRSAGPVRRNIFDASDLGEFILVTVMQSSTMNA
jgi:hypothetical protein